MAEEVQNADIVPIDIGMLRQFTRTDNESRELINDVQVLKIAVDEKNKVLRGKYIEKLEEEHEAYLLECQRQKKAFDQLQAELPLVESDKRESDKAFARAHTAHAVAKQDKLSPLDFPTKKQLQAWQENVDRLYNASSLAERKAKDKERALEMIHAEISHERSVLQGMAAKDADMRRRINQLKGTEQETHSTVGLVTI